MTLEAELVYMYVEAPHHFIDFIDFADFADFGEEWDYGIMGLWNYSTGRYLHMILVTMRDGIPATIVTSTICTYIQCISVPASSSYGTICPFVCGTMHLYVHCGMA